MLPVDLRTYAGTSYDEATGMQEDIAWACAQYIKRC